MKQHSDHFTTDNKYEPDIMTDKPVWTMNNSIKLKIPHTI